MNTHFRSRWPLAFPSLSEHNHVMILVALSFLSGTLSLFHLTGGAWLFALALIGALLAVLLHKSGHACGASLAILFFALGALWVNAAFHTDAPAPGRYEITGSVAGDVRLRSDSRISFVLEDVALDGQPVAGRGYVSLHYDDAPPALFDGASIQFPGRVYQPDGRAGKPHFDFHLLMRQNDLDFGIAAYQGVTVTNTPDAAPVRDAASRVRQRIRGVYERLLGENADIAMAVFLGDKDGLGAETYASFQKLGIAHVMAVSGLHVSLLAGLILHLLDSAGIQRRKQLTMLGLFLAGYCSLTGFSAASLRAAIMLLIGMTSRMHRRRSDRLTILAAAMLAVLVIDPLQAFSAGFVLSFSAVLGIVLYCAPLRKWLDRAWKPVRLRRNHPRSLPLLKCQREAKGVLAMTLTAQLGVLLPTMVYFHQLPTYGIAVNLVIVPFVSWLLLPLYALCLPLSLLPGIGTAAGAVASLLTDGLLALVRLLSALPYGALRTAAPSIVLCMGVGLCLVMLARRMPGSAGRKACACVLVLAIAISADWFSRPAELRYIQLSVGQADAAVLMDGSQTILIDVGADGEAALDYLLDENRDVDALILTHLHMDHAGGVQTLLDAGIRIQQVYLPAMGEQQNVDPLLLDMLDRMRDENIPIAHLASGDELRYNKAVIRVLWPERETVRTQQNANDYPLVLHMDLDGYTLLQASDLSGAYDRYIALSADVLKAAHHGSSRGTSDAFLGAVSPDYALLSVSSGSVNHPAADTLQRLNSRGVTTLRTDRDGDLLVAVENGELSITPCKERIVP